MLIGLALMGIYIVAGNTPAGFSLKGVLNPILPAFQPAWAS
jgi:hypothetical protein